jgi:dienelactone hydrolase
MKKLLLSIPFLLVFLPLHEHGASANRTSPAGTWYLNANNSRLTLSISGDAAGPLTASLVNENGNAEVIDNITWEAPGSRLEFRGLESGAWQWYRTTIVEGVLTGRFSRSTESGNKPPLSSYKYHVTGWNAAYLDQRLTPRVYDVLIDSRYRGTLRFDSSPDSSNGYSGRLKIYSTFDGGAAGEEPESDVEVTRWDGARLSFVRHDKNRTQIYTGTVSGRTIAGTYTQTGVEGGTPWSGARAQVLSYGFGAPRDPSDRGEWQERTRRQLCHLMMADNPAPLSHTSTVLGSGLVPITPTPYPAERDDNPAQWPQNYRLTELRFDYSLPNPYGGEPLSRNSHGYMAVPNGLPRAGRKYPAVLAVNGHGGSAWKMMSGTDHYYWYGDAFARRGFVVLALDISHRPIGERAAPYMSAPLYSNEPRGDDPDHGNGLHPSIKAAGFDSDWEEDGERVWDAMRALDYLLAQPNVDSSRVLVTGLSMGGEITTITSALDTRVALSIPAAFSPDLGVLQYHGNHPCWRWLNADIREYVDTSDLFALIAPRPLIVETGKIDTTYSRFLPPFAADKEVVRRARVAYGGETGNLVHYLHYDQHNFHAGDVNPTHAAEANVRIPEVIQPTAQRSSGWQMDGHTYALRGTLFDLVSGFLGGGRGAGVGGQGTGSRGQAGTNLLVIATKNGQTE